MFSSLLGSILLVPTLLLSTDTVKAEPIGETQPSVQQAVTDLNLNSSTNAIGRVIYDYDAPILADRGAPSGSRGGGSRSCVETNNSQEDCTAEEAATTVNQPELTALTPAIQVSDVSDTSDSLGNGPYESVLSLTTQENPTFWFYIPYELNTITLEFTLRNEAEHQLYQATLPSNSVGSTGIVKVTLPEHAPDLQMNTRYKWSLIAEGAPDTPHNLEYVFGEIERVPLDPALYSTLADANPRDQAALYASNGLWQEAITLLGDLYRAAPGDPNLAKDWYSLLESVDLEYLAQQPFTDCCDL
jgi:hypothetical protein